MAAVFPAMMVPAALPALKDAGVSDWIRGVIVGALLGASLLMLAIALRRPA